MKYTAPAYYYDFHCIASACPDSCCKDWEVDVDRKAADFYQTLESPLGAKLRQVLQSTEDGARFTIQNGRCPMWRPDGLCEIQCQYGHEALCRVCREYPRLQHDYGSFMELDLELSCPEAARLILSDRDGQTVSGTLPGGDMPDYDPEIMEILLRTRRELLEFLHTTALPLPRALAVMLLYSHDVQSELDGGPHAELNPSDCLADALQYAGEGNLQGIFDFFLNLEILTPQWKARLEAGPCCGPWGDSALIRYLIGRYWLQAVSDYDLICRVKFMLVSCLLIHFLGQDPVETAQLFSKEIENDPDNVDCILDGAYTDSALTDINLLRLLLN